MLFTVKSNDIIIVLLNKLIKLAKFNANVMMMILTPCYCPTAQDTPIIEIMITKQKRETCLNNQEKFVILTRLSE